MVYNKPKVGVFFCGGGSLYLDRRKKFIVQKESEMERWLDLQAELKIVANLQTHFVCGEEDAMGGGVSVWQEVAKRVWGQRENIQGAVVLYPTPQLSFVAAGLDVMLPRFDLPVVVTGDHIPRSAAEARKSAAYHTLGAKSNLINAVHTATRDLAGAALLYDSDVFRADDVTRESAFVGGIFSSFSGNPLGMINLGVHLNKDRVRRADVRNPAFVPQLASSVGVVQWLPGVSESSLVAQARAAKDGVIVRAEPEELSEALLRKFLSRLGDIPAYLYSKKSSVDFKGIQNIRGIPFEIALARVMASLGRGVSIFAL